jgi:hypothetical protein
MTTRSGSFPLLRYLPITTIAVLLLTGCGDPAVEPIAPVDEIRQVGGIYRVSGTTLELSSGISRNISGLLVVRQEGEHYSTKFELATEYRQQGRGDGMSAEVIGAGTGRVDGDTLRGTATTQFVLAMIPGIDTKFAFLPRQVGPRVLSTTVAKMLPDGRIEIEIESRPQQGEEYVPTRTALTGHRVGDVGRAPDLPEIAAPPARYPSDREATR